MSATASDGTIFVVEDDVRLQRTLKVLFDRHQLKSEIFSSGREILDCASRLDTGCLLVDLRLPDGSGLEVYEKLVASGVRLPVIVMTGFGDVPTAVQAMKAGAIDFIEKPFDINALLERVRHALDVNRQARQRQSLTSETATRLASLTPRERQVLDHLVLGRRSKTIASELGISTRTVEFHRARVMEKMAAGSISHLVRMVVSSEGGAPSRSDAQRER
jgi:two-component system response regulator FixJ